MYFNNLINDFFPFRNSTPLRSFRPQSTQSIPYNEEQRNINIIINKILSEKSNYICFDCNRQLNGLNYFDLKNGIFLCYNCALQHQKYSKEISEVVTGNIRTLDKSYLMPLYYGGNKNLIDFIQNNYPLLEKKGHKNIYTSRALNYYRELLFSKTNNIRPPIKPSLLDGYNSIYCEKPKNSYKDYHNNYRENLESEPADINNKKNCDDNDAEMTDESSNSNLNNNESDINSSQDSESEEKEKEKNINKKSINLNKEIPRYNKTKEMIERCLTVNQLGNINMYPDAKAIDEMDC